MLKSDSNSAKKTQTEKPEFPREPPQNCSPNDIYQLREYLNVLRQREKFLDQEIERFNDAGVQVEDAPDIINTLHEYNQLKDSVDKVFGFLAKLKNTTVKALYEAYDLPLQDSSNNKEEIGKKTKTRAFKSTEVVEVKSTVTENSEDPPTKRICCEEPKPGPSSQI